MSITIPATGSGTPTPDVSTDVVAAKHMQNVKVDVGGAGVSSPLVRGQQTKANSLPLVLPSDSTIETDLDKAVAQSFDLDTGAGVAATVGFAQLLPANGGAVVGGTATNPIRQDPTGTTTQPVSVVSPTTIFNGKTTVTTAGTRVTLAASQAIRSVTIKALLTNTDKIFVGNATVAAANGLVLNGGDSVSLDIANLNTVNIDSVVNGEGVTYLGVN